MSTINTFPTVDPEMDRISTGGNLYTVYIHENDEGLVKNITIGYINSKIIFDVSLVFVPLEDPNNSSREFNNIISVLVNDNDQVFIFAEETTGSRTYSLFKYSFTNKVFEYVVGADLVVGVPPVSITRFFESSISKNYLCVRYEGPGLQLHTQVFHIDTNTWQEYQVINKNQGGATSIKTCLQQISDEGNVFGYISAASETGDINRLDVIFNDGTYAVSSTSDTVQSISSTVIDSVVEDGGITKPCVYVCCTTIGGGNTFLTQKYRVTYEGVSTGSAVFTIIQNARISESINVMSIAFSSNDFYVSTYNECELLQGGVLVCRHCDKSKKHYWYVTTT